jgi:serine/threonine protein kinase/type II secretory pathway pseudopilin PulG
MNPPMPTADKCPQCGTPLSPGALTGLCPACLLKAGAADDTVTDAKHPPFHPPTVGELAAKFPQLEILELIGKGGMGAVYKARQKQLDRLVALKILPPGIGSDAAFAERFTREARALAKLNHPNIVTLYEFGETSGQYYFLMEFVDGVNLRQLLHTSRISAREALAIVPQICDALQFAHDHGIVHRDIKPENILLDRRGHVKVADFGLAKIIVAAASDRPASPLSESERPSPATGNLTDAGKVMGTPQYMSPEQKENPGEVDHRADIYALGVVFYQMLTGELPGKRIEPPSKKVQIDVRLDEIVLRALEKKPELRFQQASAMKTQVETISAEPEKPGIQIPKPKVKSRFSRTAIMMAAGIAIIGAIVVLSIIENRYATPPTKLSQAEFLSMFESNQIAHATINMSGQTSQLTPISGTYYQTDKDGKLTRKEILFVAPNVLLTQKMLDELLSSDRIDAGTHNAMLMSVIWGIVPFIFLGMIFLLIPGIIIYVLWRAVRKRAANTAPPLLKKSDTFLRWFAVTTLAMIIVVFLIAMLGLIAGIAIPNFIKAREQTQTLQLQQMEARTQTEASTNFYIGQTYFPNGDSIEITSVERTGNQMTVKGHYDLVSADEASLWLNLTATNDDEVPNQAELPQSIHISKGRGDFQLSHSHLVPGLPHVSMYNHHHPFASIYFGTKDEAEEETRLVLSAAASTETWSPELKSGEKPDLQKIRGQIQTLMNSGDYEGALQRQIWYFNHALEFGELDPIRLSFGIMNWAELGRRYPRAKLALTEIRDRDVRQFAGGNGYFALFSEVENINRELPDENSTEALFHSLEQSDPKLAQQCYPVIADQLAQRGEYETCRKYMGDPLTQFEIIRSEYELNLENQKHLAAMSQLTARQMAVINHQPNGTNLWFHPDNSAFLKRNAESRFIGQTRQLIEILVATDTDPSTAQDIQNKALSVLNVPQLQSAVSDAENKIQHKLESPANNSNQTDASSLNFTTNKWLLDSTASLKLLYNQPPVVVETFPLSGAREVEPGETEIRVRFSKEMTDGSWSWSTAWENSTPEFIGSPHYEPDGKTCVIQVKLEPDRTYAFWLNSDNFQNFKDRDGRPAVPYLLIFQTKHQ